MKTNGKTPATARNEIRRSQSFAWYLKPLFTTSTKMLRFFILTKAQLSLILQYCHAKDSRGSGVEFYLKLI